MDIIIKEGLANGRVFKSELIQDYAYKLDVRIDQLALACILAQDFAPRVLSGAVTAEQLKSNWKALEMSKSMDKSSIQELMQSAAVKSEDYWSERSSLEWN